MRFFDGPNGRDYQLITIDGPYTAVTWPRTPTSQQAAATKGEFTIGSITASVVPGYRYRLTEPDHVNKLITGMTLPGGGDCTVVTAPPNGTGMCAYYVKYARYMITRVPYTTGMFQAWHPIGNTNTIQTSTGYDNRTAAGLNGTISLVHPRLVHAYLSHPSAIPPKEIRASWGSARSRKINFMFAPEPAGVAMLAAGVATLAGLYRLRRR
jgi:hypothetical protein